GQVTDAHGLTQLALPELSILQLKPVWQLSIAHLSGMHAPVGGFCVVSQRKPPGQGNSPPEQGCTQLPWKHNAPDAQLPLMLGIPVQSVETPLHWLGWGPTSPWQTTARGHQRHLIFRALPGVDGKSEWKRAGRLLQHLGSPHQYWSGPARL